MKIIITESQLNFINEAVGVPEHIIQSAEELYDIVVDQLKKLNNYDIQQTLTVDGLNLKISDYVIKTLNLTIKIYESDEYEGPVKITSASVGNKFKFDRDILMKVNQENNTIDLILNFISEENDWDAKKVYECFTDDKIKMTATMAHEMKHKFDKQKKKITLIGKDADYQAYASQNLRFGIAIIDKFMRYSYFIHGAENLVRPPEMATRMKLKGVTKDNFIEFFENDETFKSLKEIRDFSYEYFISQLKEEMDNIEELFDRIGIDYNNMSEDEKIKNVLRIVYISLAHAKKDFFDRMTDDGFSKKLSSIFGIPVNDDDEEFDKVRRKFLNYVIKYQNKEEQFFIDECERFNYEATKLIKRLTKIYSLIPDEKEQTNESIINWDLHQKLMEKKYGKMKIQKDYKFFKR